MKAFISATVTRRGRQRKWLEPHPVARSFVVECEAPARRSADLHEAARELYQSRRQVSFVLGGSTPSLRRVR